MTKGKAPADDVSKALDLLNQALKVEYSMIVQYPQFAEMIQDEMTKRRVIALGIASTEHADVVSRAIVKLGGTPDWSFEFVDRDIGVLSIFKMQLEKEKAALEMHQQTASLIQDDTLKQQFTRIAEDEQMHIKTVETIIAGLN